MPIPKVGDCVQFTLDDCCMAAHGKGIVEELVEYEDVGPTEPSEERFLGIKVGGVSVQRCWPNDGDWIEVVT